MPLLIADGTTTGFIAKFRYESTAGKMPSLPPRTAPPSVRLIVTEKHFTLISPTDFPPSVVRVFNGTGRLLLKKTAVFSENIVLDKGDLERGILFFTVQTPDGMKTVSVPNIR